MTTSSLGRFALAIITIATAALYSIVANAQTWQQLPGAAYDIGAGGGSVWVIGTAPVSRSGHGIYRWNGTNWDSMPGTGERIAVDSNGNAWVVNAQHDIFAFDGMTFHQLPGSAYDIGSGGGSVWVIGSTPVSRTGRGIYRWNGGNWDLRSGAGIAIAVEGADTPWVINARHEIFKRVQ